MFRKFRKFLWRGKILADMVNKQTEVVKNNKLGYHSPFYQPKRYEYIHIPKCGGTSIASVLTDLPNFGEHKHKPISNYDYAKIVNGDNLETRYITFLRNPIDRVWSYYQMIKRDNHYAWGRYTASLHLFLENCWEVNNVLMQYLTLKIRQNHFDKQDFEFAHQALESFYFVGFLSRFNDDWGLLQQKLLNDEGYILKNLPHLNESPKRTLPSADEVKLIQTHNHLDLMLYQSFQKSRSKRFLSVAEF